MYPLRPNRTGGMVVSSEFLSKRTDLFKRLKAASELTDELEQAVVDVYDSRGKRALAAIKDGGVRRQDGRWFVRGNDAEYEIVRTYCTCYDYVLNVVTEKVDVDMCYHALAKTIFDLLGSRR